MNRLIIRAARRFYARHPWQLALAIAGISLGVGVFVGVSLANDSASRAFDAAGEQLRGTLTHRLVAIEGGLEDGLFRHLSVELGVTPAVPAVQGRVTVLGEPNREAQLVGLDPLGMGEWGVATASAGLATSALSRLLVEPGSVLLPAELATELGADADDTLRIDVDGRERSVRVTAVVPESVAGLESVPTMITDIATAQELLSRIGRLDRIDLRLTDAEAAELAADLPTGTALLPFDGERSGFRQLQGAFRINLRALGLLSLVVGAFLIYSTMSFAVLQRTATLGILRTLGVTRMETIGTVLAEAATIAAVATGLGLVVGHLLAVGLVELVLQTIGDLSFRSVARPLTPSPWIYAQGAILGVGVTLVAAVKPAFDAGRVSLAAALRRSRVERDAHVAARRAGLLAVVLGMTACALLAFGPSSLAVGFAGLFLFLAAGALATPLATLGLMAGIEGLLGGGGALPARLAIRGVSSALSRTGVATAALAIAVATVNGVGLMIGTFRTSLGDWLDTTLTADVYVTSSDGRGLAALVASGALSTIPGIESMAVTRVRTLPTTAHGPLTLRAVRPGDRGFGLNLVTARGDASLLLATGRGVAASERLALTHQLVVGSEVTLPTPSGTERLPIVATFQDFSISEPVVVMDLRHYQAIWHDTEVSSVGLDVAGEQATVVEAVRGLLGDQLGARVRSTGAIKEISLQVFDRTFEVTEVLRWLAGIVAFLGILSALLAVELERGRELGVLRTLGFTPRGLAATLLTQTGLLGATAGLAAVPLGTGLAALLVFVINRRSFGWSMDFVVTPATLGAGMALAVTAALLAGVYPAWRASRVELAAALREE